jgi:archaellum component FlaG (FlaF/FlaG flagellin family)
MNERRPDPKFEEDIRAALGAQEPRAEFMTKLASNLARRASEKTSGKRPALRLRPAWTIAAAILTVLILVTLAIGPQKVFAAVRQLFGYIPGIGIIEQGDNLRILAEPVTQTREGITVMVSQAVLTAAGTQLEYSITGVSLSAYPREESNPGCMDAGYLRLPDGTQLVSGFGGGTNNQYNFDYPAIPAATNQVTFVMPCILNTLPGAAPENWELPLRFIPAPADFEILPVIEVSPQATVMVQGPESPEAAAIHATISVDQVIETKEGYILVGAVRPQIQAGEYLQITGIAILKDATGRTIAYDFPMDVNPPDEPEVMMQGGSSWALQIKGTGVKFPLTITFMGVVISQVDPQASASLVVDAGDNPQPGQVFELNQEVAIAGETITLVSMTVESDGYTFAIDPGNVLSEVSVAIEGKTANGGGGGGWGGTFYTSLSYDELPVGELTLHFTNPLAAGPSESWQTTWGPEATREFTPDGSGQTCWNVDTIGQIPLLPDGLDGKIVFTRVNPQLQIIMANMDGTEQQVLAEGNARGALSLDGARLAYSSSAGLVIMDLAGGPSTTLPGEFGRDLSWSPDGNWIAGVNAGERYGVFVTGSDGQGLRQLTQLGTESIAGWSPDGSRVYYAIPGGTDGFMLREVNVANGISEDLFVLENSSVKAPMPALSPDGQWIAYRARDNNSIYLMGLSGGPARLLMEKPGLAVNGLAWERGGHLLGVSVMTDDIPDGLILLIAADSCETYRLPDLSGELDAVIIP